MNEIFAIRRKARLKKQLYFGAFFFAVSSVLYTIAEVVIRGWEHMRPAVSLVILLWSVGFLVMGLVRVTTAFVKFQDDEDDHVDD